MKLEGEYATSASDRFHRIASSCVFVILVTIIGIRAGPAYAFRAGAIYLLPMGCIWFPQVLAFFRGGVPWDRRIDAPSHPKFLRWAGWFLLLA